MAITPLPHRLLLPTAMGLGLSLLSVLPARAHGLAGGDWMAGASHPLLGLDHLLLLVAVGGVTARSGPQLLLAALAGALIGGLLGGLGLAVPGLELLAALVVAALGLALLRRPAATPLGWLVAGALAIHATLHGQEAHGNPAWWLGAGLASATVVLLSASLLRQLDNHWVQRLAITISVAGSVLAIASLA